MDPNGVDFKSSFSAPHHLVPLEESLKKIFPDKQVQSFQLDRGNGIGYKVQWKCSHAHLGIWLIDDISKMPNVLSFYIPSFGG